jgi:hypothetical protein
MNVDQLNSTAFTTLGLAKFFGITSLVFMFLHHHIMAGSLLSLAGLLLFITVVLCFKALKLQQDIPYEEIANDR